MSATQPIPPLRLGWADARRFPLTVSLLKCWEKPYSDTVLHLAALQMHRAISHGVPSILD